MVADSYSDMSSSSTGDPSNLPPPCTSPMMGVEGGEDPFRSLSPHSSLFCSRKQREFTPDAKKDDSYWDRRRRNNAAAKRSREKRRINDMMLEKRVIQLSRENHILRAQVTAVFKSYGIRAETLVDMDQVLATLPSEDQILSVACGPSSSTRHAMSPPPLAATSITLPSAAPTRPEADLYQTFRARSPSNERPRPQCVILRERDEPLHGASPAKRPAFMHHHVQAWEMEPRASSAGSNSENSEDALNLTTTSSRSRSSSEAEEDFHMHMPHKLRYKYGSGHLSPVSSSIKSEEDF